jgi:predicted GNAT family acetyltransferase
MPIDLETLKIIHNEAESRFEVEVDGYPSKLDYFMDGKSFVITHVGVHPELRGQGVAGKITQTALEYAKANSLRVIPMCGYAAAYIRRNPQYAELVKQQDDE